MTSSVAHCEHSLCNTSLEFASTYNLPNWSGTMFWTKLLNINGEEISRKQTNEPSKTTSWLYDHKNIRPPHYFTPTNTIQAFKDTNISAPAGMCTNHTNRELTHLVPGDVQVLARFNVVVYVRAEDVFTLAELSLLSSSHVGVVAQIRVIFCHGQRHGHFHAVCWIPVCREHHDTTRRSVFTYLMSGVQWKGIRS